MAGYCNMQYAICNLLCNIYVWQSCPIYVWQSCPIFAKISNYLRTSQNTCGFLMLFSRYFSIAWPTRNMTCSSHHLPMICIPIGRPCVSQPTGTVMHGIPSRLPIATNLKRKKRELYILGQAPNLRASSHILLYVFISKQINLLH